MIKRDRQICVSFPAKGLDAAVNERFGSDVECTTKIDWESNDPNYHTKFKATGLKADAIRLFIDGFIGGNRELVRRLSEKNCVKLIVSKT